MKKYTILLSVIFFHASYADAPYWQAKEVIAQHNTDWPGYENVRSSHDMMNTFNHTKEYHYQILLNEWLKNADQNELKAIRTNEAFMARMNGQEISDSTSKILKAYYNIKMSTFVSSAIGHMTDLPFQIVYTPEQIWILFSLTSRRAVWHKYDKKSPIWATVNAPELRDNNAYTFLLRKLEFDKVYQCPSSQNTGAGGISSNDVDSVTALTFAAAKAAECHGAKMTPIAARRMGMNKEYWLVYCFRSIHDNTKDQEEVYRIFVHRYKKGFSIWNMRDKLCYDSYPLYLSRCSDRGVHVVTVLISANTGQVLYMN